jgi:DNA invertase Pin-like site-specific DNA recombinase
LRRYVLVSTLDQTLALLRDALEDAGREKVFADQGVNGIGMTRPGLDRALKAPKSATL